VVRPEQAALAHEELLSLTEQEEVQAQLASEL
jgi:hypothetical protein